MAPLPSHIRLVSSHLPHPHTHPTPTLPLQNPYPTPTPQPTLTHLCNISPTSSTLLYYHHGGICVCVCNMWRAWHVHCLRSWSSVVNQSLKSTWLTSMIKEAIIFQNRNLIFVLLTLIIKPFRHSWCLQFLYQWSSCDKFVLKLDECIANINDKAVINLY